MKKLVLFAAVAAVVSLSACKKAPVEAPVVDEPAAIEAVEEAPVVDEAAVEVVEEAVAPQ